MGQTKTAMVYAAVEALTGNEKSRTLVDTGNASFVPTSARLVGKSLLLTDNKNRCLSLGVANGEIAGRAFGNVIGTDPARGLVAVENGPGDVHLYALPDMREKAHFQFPAEVRATRFVPGKSQFLALTDDQELFRVALP
jgi:hypothetical protein